MPDGLTEVGWGIVVGAQESWARQDEDGWRRPLAFGKMGTKGPSECASCPRGMHGGAGEMGTDASWISMENDQRCCAVCGARVRRGTRHGILDTVKRGSQGDFWAIRCT